MNKSTCISLLFLTCVFAASCHHKHRNLAWLLLLAGPATGGELGACGDGRISGPETCDDGNLKTGDGCSTTCKVESGFVCIGTPSACFTGMCGDGFIMAGEGCDDANAVNGDGCSNLCLVESGYTCVGTPSVCTH